jgi:hypothetical protein
VWLAALALPGIAALWRFAPFLTPLERFAHGTVLGIVVGTLVLIPTATLFGLQVWLVVLVGVASVAAALALWLAPGGAGGRTAHALTPRDRVRHLRAWLLAGWMPWALRLDPWGSALFGALSVRWLWLWGDALQVTANGLWAGHEYIWSDWPTHIGIVTRFAYGDNFMPQNTLFAGLPLSYHYLSDLTPAAMVVLGMNVVDALPLHSLLLSLVAALSLWAFIRRLGILPSIATLGTVLFLFGGGLAWIGTLGVLDRTHDLFGTLLSNPYDEQFATAFHIRFFNPYLAFLMSQRAYLYGLPIAMLMITLLVSAARRRSMPRFVLAGVVGGLLPLAHLPTLLAMAITVPFLALFLPGLKAWRDPRRAIPWTGWIAFGLIWIAVSLPQLFTQLGGGAGALSAFRIQVGWVAAPDEWWWFWIKNLGLFIPLAIVGFFARRILPPRSMRVVLALMPIFVIVNLAVFQPWDWDDHKILIYWFLGVAVIVGALIVRTWQRHGSLAVRFLLVLAVATMIAAPVLENLDQLEGHMRYRMIDTEQIAMAEQLRAATQPHDLVVSGMESHDPVMMLSGRQVLMGYWGQLWVSGIPYEDRQREVQEIYRLSPAGEQAIRDHGVAYVVIGPDEIKDLGADQAAFDARFPVIVQTEHYRVYDVRSLRDQGSTTP